MNFADAKYTATALGGYLINSMVHNRSAIWIAANDIDTEGTWIWDNGTTIGDVGLTDTICNATSGYCTPSNATLADGYRIQNEDEPNNSGDEDCANITRSDGTWNDLPSSRKLYGIIEFEN